MLRRLQLLFHHGYLDRPPGQLDWYAKGSQPLVYSLGKKSVKELKSEGRVVRGWVHRPPKNRRISPLFLRHTLAAMVSVEVHCRNDENVAYISPEEVLAKAPTETRKLSRPFHWQVEVHHEGIFHRLGVEPDAVFGLRFKRMPENRRHAYFFLEADRGTMPVERSDLRQSSLLRKVLCYQETWRQGIHKALLGIANFRVLVVAGNGARAKKIDKLVRALEVQKTVLVVTELKRRSSEPPFSTASRI
jgi:Replication-relaxation